MASPCKSSAAPSSITSASGAPERPRRAIEQCSACRIANPARLAASSASCAARAAVRSVGVRRSLPQLEDLAVVSADVPRTSPESQRRGSLDGAQLLRVLDAFVASSTRCPPASKWLELQIPRVLAVLVCGSWRSAMAQNEKHKTPIDAPPASEVAFVG